jgi:hypothetical protein
VEKRINQQKEASPKGAISQEEVKNTKEWAITVETSLLIANSLC